MFGQYNNISIRGIVTAVPSYIETNERYIDILGEKRVKKQTKMTGVFNRRINNPDQHAADLCIVAARDLMEKLSWKKEDIKFVVFITQHPSFVIPATSFFIQKELGLSQDCMVFDVNLGCSGYTSGLHILSSLIQNQGDKAKGLLLVGETQRTKQMENIIFTPENEADRMLFGSAGSATAIELEEEHKLYFMEKSNGESYNAIIQYNIDEPYRMDGEAVFEFSITDVIDYLKEFEVEFGIKDTDVDYYVFHQAQKFILKNIAITKQIDDSKMLYSLEEYGNTSSVSIPLTICHNKSLYSNKTMRFVLCGFGIGLSCSAIYVSLDKNCILDMIETDECIVVNDIELN